MAFDPRCVAFEGRLHADRCTAEYVGRASHDTDAACFRSCHAVTASTRSPMPRTFYFETQIQATSRTAFPARTNTSNVSVFDPPHPSQPDPDMGGPPRDPDVRRREEVHAMDLEDVHLIPAPRAEPVEIPVNFSFSLPPRAQINRRRRCHRSNGKTRFHHKIAVGFLLDKAERKNGSAWGGRSSSSLTRGCFSTSKGRVKARESRRAIKQFMQHVLSHVAARNESKEEQEKPRAKLMTQESTSPAILHQDLGKRVNSVAYVGKTGCVVSNGRVFLQCERYGTGDVVGCGVLLDTNTFFFTLNGKLMGLLAARDVYDLDTFGHVDYVDEEESDDEELESGEEDDMDSSVGADNGRRTQLDRNDDDIDDVDGGYEDEKVLFPSVSLHGVGECVRAVFEPDEFQFDLSGFEQQIHKKRQRALLAERERRNENDRQSDVEQSLYKDEAAMNELVQDFFLHYGYKSAYEAFESVKREGLASDGMEMDCSGKVEASAGTHSVGSVGDTEDEGKIENMDIRDLQPSKHSLKDQMRKSLSLRDEVCKRIRCFRTAEALAVLEQHVPALMTIAMGFRSRRCRKLILYCRILCVIDVLTCNKNAKATTFSPSLANGASGSLKSLNLEEVECNGWNPESAIEFARQIFGSSVECTTNGKRKRIGISNNKTQKKCVDRHDVALVMSLLLYDQRDSIPKTSHARKFLTSEFRELVADQLNSLLLMGDNYSKTESRISALETFMTDLESLQKECLYKGCRVYPESVEATSDDKSKTTSHRLRASVSSSSDDSSSSESEQDDRLDDEDNDDE